MTKVLCHIRCGDAARQIEDFKTVMRTTRIRNLNIAVSVVNPDIVAPELREGQRALNRAVVDAAREFVSGELWRVITVIRDNMDQPVPKGTMRVHVNRQIDAEGVKVWDSR
jgi:hypothetical protein